MGLRLHRQNPVVSGASAVPAAQVSRGASVARTLRTCRWPRLLLAGVVLTVVGVVVLSAAAQALVVLLGALVFFFAAYQGLAGRAWSQDRVREPPVPPGGRGPF
jgi:hypothetical protein